MKAEQGSGEVADADHLRDARRMTDARTSVPSAATPPTIAMPMYPSETVPGQCELMALGNVRLWSERRTSRYSVVDEPGQALRLEVCGLLVEEQGCGV